MALRGVLEVAQRHGEAGVTHQLLDARESHASARTMHPKGVPEIVRPDTVQFRATASRLEGSLGALVTIQRKRKDAVSGATWITQPVSRQELGEWGRDRQVADTSLRLNALLPRRSGRPVVASGRTRR